MKFRVPVILALVATSSAAHSTTMYTMTDIGTLGGTVTYSLGINDQGVIVGGTRTSLNVSVPFAYNGSMQQIGTSSGLMGSALAINQLGHVAGYDTSTGTSFVYDGSVHELPIPNGPPEFNGSEPWGINASGHVVGDAFTSGGGSQAFFYDGQMHILPTRGVGGVGYARGINDRDEVVGFSTTAGGADHAFLYSNGTLQDLGALGGEGSFGEAINNKEQIVGTAELAGGHISDAFLYDGAMHDLGNLGGAESVAYAISDMGRIVGASLTASDGPSHGAWHAFVYDGAMTDLNSLVVGGTNGVILLEARGVNNSGQIVVNASNNRSYLLTPVPIPAPFWLMFFSAGALGYARRLST